MKRLVLLIFLFFFLFCQNVFAATLSIQNTPSSVSQFDEFKVDVSLGCSGCSDSYLRGVFYDSGTSYFGYTQDNSGNFSNASGSNCTTFFKIAQSDLISGSWSGKIKFKPDPSSSYYKGSGEYSFKIGRYTSSCSSPSVWSQETLISIVGPTSTPTSVPSATPVFSPTKTPTPTKAQVSTGVSPTSKSTSKLSVKGVSIAPIKNNSSSSGDVFNIKNTSPTVEKPKDELENSGSNNKIFLVALLVGGISIIIAAGILIKKYYKEIMEWIST